MVEGVLYVPFTPQSSLKKTVQQGEEEWRGHPLAGRIRVEERLGPSISQLLCNPTPWRKEHCGRAGCPPCETTTGKCKARNVIYKVECTQCKVEGNTGVYWGESHRTLWDRTSEHLANLRRGEDSSPLVKHWKEVHASRDTPPHYTFHLVGVHQDALSRQLGEALMISGDTSTYLMNSKGEFGRNSLVSQTTSYNGDQ